ncbi:hypothetical protein [Mycobacterium sp. ITM-2016-00318]|uniref:hypothetical protein n=1 Tax=Mycobacterium sp. ITM-2016-00318 TaxID=2099693 RepID=UPI0018EDAE0B|nr:hypothetical protein [Mycobacterium sp. ITM-2016-00318]WNG92472.1 hypothetical protein C6A82_024245 [Mycobacterium sp. ITM-2016-00318]
MATEHVRGLRLFVADAAGENWSELTAGGTAAVRIAAPDLHEARRVRGRITDDVAVILDITVAIAADYRSARHAMPRIDGDTLHYAGTIEGLAGLVGDIFMADVADGVTIIPASPEQDMRRLADEALDRIARRLPLAGAA